MRSRLSFGLGAFALLLLWYVARYGDATSYFFHYDDFWLLRDGSLTHSLGDVLRPGKIRFVLYRPFSQVGHFWIRRVLFGYDPAPYHAVQLLSHVFNAFLTYGIASAVLRSRWYGIGAALVYAAAPGHAIAVYWNALYSMTGTVSWYLGCLWVWIADPEDRHPTLRWIAAFLLFLGALLSSEHAVTLPVALGLASLLVRGELWRPALWRLSPFLVLAIAYGAAKVAYMRYWLDFDFPDPLMSALIRGQYQPVFDPVASLRLLGFYTGCAFGWIYEASSEAPRCYAVGAMMLALLAASAWWARTSEAGRRVLFGLLLFGAALGPVLMLPSHPYSYYVGSAGAGTAIAVMAAVQAVPRSAAALAVGVVALILAGEVLVGEPRAKDNVDFRFFRDFQVAALRWLTAVEAAARSTPDVKEVVAPDSGVTRMVFTEGLAHRWFFGATYDVRLVPREAMEAPGPGKAVVERTKLWRSGTQYPGNQAKWDWLRRTNPWAKE